MVCENLYKAPDEDNPFYQPVHIHVMNPKSITMEELYGGIDKLTLEWRDGLMAITVRQAVQVSKAVVQAAITRVDILLDVKIPSCTPATRRAADVCDALADRTRRLTTTGLCATALSTRCGSRT